MSDPAAKLQCYLVGGAVRDQLLGLPIKDRDWVVVGSTPAQMRQLGFKAVGKDFPVFLHPTSHEEYALARTERKSAPGYKGFQFHTSADVTLEQDLKRRDLTINAIAQHASGELVDPFDGANDIKAKKLRHVSNAFAEDPVRVLRVARFSARFADKGFTIAVETMELMNQMVDRGEVDHLVAERIWQELHGALSEPSPAQFISNLKSCGALQRIFPEIDALFGVPQPAKHHPEIDTGEHTLMVLTVCAELSDAPDVRFAALLHDLGKALTLESELPRHTGHENAGVAPIQTICKRLRVPKAYQELAILVCKFHLRMHTIMELKPATAYKLLKSLDAFRRPQRVESFALACEADARGRKGLENREYPQRQYLADIAHAAREVNVDDLVSQGLRGDSLGAAIEQRRIAAIARIVNR